MTKENISINSHILYVFLQKIERQCYINKNRTSIKRNVLSVYNTTLLVGTNDCVSELTVAFSNSNLVKGNVIQGASCIGKVQFAKPERL